MQNVKILCSLFLFVSVITCVTWLVGAGTATSGKVDSMGAANMREQEKSKLPKDPCWFMTLKDESVPYEKIKEWQDREAHGYPTEIRLSEAIRVFNEEKQCSGLLAPYPPLTEDELIAAIVGGPDYGKQGEVWQSQKDALWKIATRKIMPKGSLLVAEPGYRIQDSPLRPDGTIEAKGIRITLLLGLDSLQHGQLLKPEQTLIIRKTYTKVETVR